MQTDGLFLPACHVKPTSQLPSPHPQAAQRPPAHLLPVWLASLCVLLSAVLFSAKAIIIKYAFALEHHDASPASAILLLTLRMLTALPFFVLMIILTHRPAQTSRKQWLLLWIAGLMGYYAASIMDFIGLTYISASLERLILFLYPTLTVIFTAIWLRRPVTPLTIVAILLSYGGTLVVMLAGDLMHQPNHHLWLGSAWVFASAVAYALYLMMTPRLIAHFGAIRFTGLASTIAAGGCLLHFLLEQSQPIQHLLDAPPVIWLCGLILGIFSTVLPATLLMLGVARIGAASAALLSAIGPVVTIVLAWGILGEQLNGWQWPGCLINICGVLLITRQPAAPQREASSVQPTVPRN